MTIAVIGLSILALQLFAMVLLQRKALFRLRRTLGAYREEIERANQLMSVMAREDVAVKSQSERHREQRAAGR